MVHVLAGKISADIFGVRTTIVWIMSSPVHSIRG